jgi:hypothetical protein
VNAKALIGPGPVLFPRMFQQFQLLLDSDSRVRFEDLVMPLFDSLFNFARHGVGGGLARNLPGSVTPIAKLL